MLGLFALSFGANAQDAAAKKVLDGVSAKVKAAKGITANFSIKTTTSKGTSAGAKSGSISIKGQKYFLKQGKTEIISDGKTVWNYDGSKTITISSADENTNTLSPQNLLSNFYDKDFTYKLISSAGNTHQIEMYPTDKRKNFEKVTVYVDKTKGLITKAKVVDKAKNTIEFTLSNLKTNAVINDKVFVFNRAKYPKDAEVID
ncbi:MAG: outer rane lipoprotein carrier protein LolA [Chitinophagaceae bacterium]|jgi:chaperone LolA|nr:outer rane lipoprotein carrier protein LolA [Chitinophagaceae bacterium]